MGGRSGDESSKRVVDKLPKLARLKWTKQQLGFEIEMAGQLGLG